MAGIYSSVLARRVVKYKISDLNVGDLTHFDMDAFPLYAQLAVYI